MLDAFAVVNLVHEQGHRLNIIVLDDYAQLLRQVNEDEFLVAVHDKGLLMWPVFIQDMDQFVESFKLYFDHQSLGIEYYSIKKSAVLALIV